ncbi:MAG: hypothetical protein U0521_00165 [Anaerolineae bacterium]
MRTERRSLGSLSASAVTVFASIIWLLPLIFAVLMSVRPRSEPINVGNIFFGSTITLETTTGRSRSRPGAGITSRPSFSWSACWWCSSSPSRWRATPSPA